MAESANSNSAEELRRKELERRYLFESLESGVILLDSAETITAHNQGALRIWNIQAPSLAGQKIHLTGVGTRCPELAAHLEALRRSPKQDASFQCWVNSETGDDGRLISVNLKSMLTGEGERIGTVMHCVDATPEEKLRRTVEQLESTHEELQSSNEELETANEELQSTNEELETTNEELQSTNEELETTNEELQSTNEELETANEELQSLNEELENMNEELEHRTRELNQHTERYAETLRSMPFPVLLVDAAGKVQLWNAAAQKLLGVSATSMVGVNLDRLPLSNKLLDVLIRRCHAVLAHRRPTAVRGELVKAATGQELEIHFSLVSRGPDQLEGVMITFGPSRVRSAGRASPRAGAAGNRRTSPKTAKKGKSASGRGSSRRKRH
jgi:PAS domain S-box-containing protein